MKKSQDIVQTTLLSPHSTLLTNIWWQKGWGIISKPTSFTWGNKHSNETMSEPEHCQNKKKEEEKLSFFCRFESREENTSGSMPIYSRDKVLYWVLLWGQKQEERDSVGKQKKSQKRGCLTFLWGNGLDHINFSLIFGWALPLTYFFLFLLNRRGRSKAHFGVYTVEWI